MYSTKENKERLHAIKNENERKLKYLYGHPQEHKQPHSHIVLTKDIDMSPRSLFTMKR